MRATNLTDTTWYDGGAPKGERRKPRPRLLHVHLDNTIIGAEDTAVAQRSIGDRNARIYTRTIKAGGAMVTVYVVVSREKGQP